MNTYKKLIIAAIVILLPRVCSAQRWSVGTNAADWAALGTVNAEAGVAVARHVTLTASARVNPWTFREGDTERQFQTRHQTYSLGMRWWPWYVYSGWWMGAGAQYREYNRGGLFGKRETEEGDAFGASLGGGYTMMLHKHLNIEFGASLWGGYSVYTVYACPSCGRVTDSGRKWFILPSSIVTSLVWVF